MISAEDMPLAILPIIPVAVVMLSARKKIHVIQTNENIMAQLTMRTMSVSGILSRNSRLHIL